MLPWSSVRTVYQPNPSLPQSKLTCTKIGLPSICRHLGFQEQKPCRTNHLKAENSICGKEAIPWSRGITAMEPDWSSLVKRAPSFKSPGRTNAKTISQTAPWPDCQIMPNCCPLPWFFPYLNTEFMPVPYEGLDNHWIPTSIVPMHPSNAFRRCLSFTGLLGRVLSIACWGWFFALKLLHCDN